MEPKTDERPKNGLCDICRSIDFETLYSGKRVQDDDRASQSVSLGSYGDLFVRVSQCIFCKWIIQNIEHHQDRDHRLQNLSTKKIQLCCDGSTVLNGRQQSSHGVSGYLVPIVRLRVEPFDYDRDMLADLRLVKQPPPEALIPEPLTGEFVDSKATTVEQFRFWLTDCLSNHEHSTDNEELSKNSLTGLYTDVHDNIPNFTLIDVAHRRLIRTSALESVDMSYIALSYVWGTNAPAIRLGADHTLPKNLPATIEDALTLVSSLDFVPYLWIDSICIPQNDLEVRLAQIQKMDVIYDRAVATIIATGGSVHSGLTGLSVNINPSQSLRLGPRLLTYQPGPWKHLMATHGDAASHFLPWGNRGWTFQEALISRRRMIFNNTEERILYECNVTARQTHPTDVFEQVKARFFTDLDTVRRPEMGGWNLHWYQHMLNLYLQRTLSYDRDIISAFTGVAKLISRAVAKEDEEAKTCWTIPRRECLGGLMWAPTEGCKDLVYREDMLEDRRRIPSWHWARVVMGDGVAFVQGSEPGHLYEGLRNTWTCGWTEEEWDEVEKTGRIDFRGEIVDFTHVDERWQELADKAGVVNEQGVPSDVEEGAAQLSRATERLRLSDDTTELVDERQCAIKAWRERRGCFISCSAWAWAGTLEDVKQPLAIYPFAHRLGNPKPMQPNRQFVLMVEWDTETVEGKTSDPESKQTADEERKWRICRRVGWAVVDLKEWHEVKPVQERLWMA